AVRGAQIEFFNSVQISAMVGRGEGYHLLKLPSTDLTKYRPSPVKQERTVPFAANWGNDERQHRSLPDHRLPNQPPSEMLPVLPERGSVVTIDVVIAVHYHAIARYSATVDLEISHSHWFKVFTSEDAHATEPVSLRCFERLRLYWHRC